ncbi:MAG: HAMP domain-containing histidine kinase [Acidimicrobiia bacterium]|nr:HAMP domain-containing histidine kinase [Acidimicrobiia bacterium]
MITSKDQLVAAVSHELRTPMTSVVGLARELDERFDDFSEAEVREFLGLIVHESTDVANILEDLLVAARADVGNLALSVVAVDIYAEIASAVNTTSSAQVKRHSPSEKLLVAADPMRVRQILRNLIVNATRYGGPAVRVTVGSDDDLVAITVCDDGQPIPQDEREKIFLPYQGVRGSTYVPGSVGLGLTVSRQLARLMGGDLSYDYRDAESRFTLVIPRYREASADDPAPSRADAA